MLIVQPSGLTAPLAVRIEVGQGCHVLALFGVVRLVVLVEVAVESASGFESGRMTWRGRMNVFMRHNAKTIAASVLSQRLGKKSRAVFALFAAPVAHVEIAIYRERVLFEK